jgi:hypothetical protein
MNLKVISKLFFVSSLVLLSSCGFIIKSYIRKDDTNVPADFGKEKCPLLVLKVKKKSKYDKKIESDFKKYYKGEFLHISPEELHSTYADTSKYPYVFGQNREISSSTHNVVTGMPENPGSVSLSFHLYDRVREKYYDTGVSSGVSWRTVERSYIKKIESVRAKNSGGSTAK